MVYRPDISFEYHYIRIVYQVIFANFRNNKKIVEKEINYVLTKIRNIKKKVSLTVGVEIKGLISKLD